MYWWSRPSRPLLAVLGLVFAAGLLIYAFLWISVSALAIPSVQLGFDNSYIDSERSELITSVYKNSPAEKAGLRRGDRVVAFDGRAITDSSSQLKVWLRHRPGDHITLTVRRPGVTEPLLLTGVYRNNPGARPTGDFIGQQVSIWYPLPFVIVALGVLFLRLTDPNAWLLAAILG